MLKGARTIVCDGTLDDDFCSINPTGGPELATGGSGDVLAGVIGALLAQGVPAVDAARAGVYVHGLAGEQLAAEHGARGVVSSDLPLAIAGVLAIWRGSRASALETHAVSPQPRAAKAPGDHSHLAVARRVLLTPGMSRTSQQLRPPASRIVRTHHDRRPRRSA